MSGAAPEERALIMIKDAEKKLKSGGLFGLFGGTQKYEDAFDLYSRAANLYKMAKKFKEAGDAFFEAAKLQMKLANKHEAASQFVDAANCYKKGNPLAAVDCLTKAVEIYLDMGRFAMAAKQQMTVAEIYETEAVDLAKAMAAYEQAADWYQGEDSTSTANKCLLKVALYSAQLEQYAKAIEIYEKVGSAAIDNSLLKWGAKEYFLKAGICHMCTRDLVETQRALERYLSIYAGFGDTRECKLLHDMLASLEEQDAERLTSVIAEYDAITRLDGWMTTMLLRIKKGVTVQPSVL